MSSYDQKWDKLNNLLGTVFRFNTRVPYEADGTLPEWFIALLTKLHIVVGDASVRYATSSVHVDADDNPGGEAVVFTDTQVIRGQVSADGNTVVSVWSRSSLQQADLTRLDAYPQRNDFEAQGWPSQAEMRLVYPAGEIIIPQGRTHQVTVAQLLEFVQELLQDLSRRD